MPFEPDIIVTTADGPTLVVEAKATSASLHRTEEQLKRYMVSMQCPVGVLFTPERMIVYRDSYSGRLPSSVERVGDFDTKRIWHTPPPANNVFFQSFVQHWLEELIRRPDPDLPEDLRKAFEEYIEPALVSGEVRAAHVRNP